MEQYLIQLIKENNRVIIPEIGALITRNKDPLEIGFNGLLSFNDGLLTGHIIQVEGVSFKEANDKMVAFKDELLDQLNKKGEVTLKNIGTITIDAEGNKTFVGSGVRSQETGDSIKKKEEEEKEKAEAEAMKKTDEEKSRAEAEAKKKADEEKAKAGAMKKAEEEKAKADEEAKKKADEEKAKAGAMKKDEEEKAKADEEAKKKAEAEKKVGEKKDEPGAEKPVAIKGKTEKASFTLDESLTEVDVDASEDMKDVKATKEDSKSKPSFTLDETDLITEADPAAGSKEPEIKAKTEPESKTETRVGTTPVEEKTEPKYVVKESRTPKYTPPPPIEEKKVPTTAPSRKKKRVWIIPVAIVALLILALVAGYFFFPQQLNRILPEKIASILPERGQQADETLEPVEAIVEEPIIEEPSETFEQTESISAETEEVKSPAEEPAQEKPAESVPATTSTGKQYYIVAGCFGNRSNADKYASDLQQEGFNSRVFGTRPGNLHAVCFDSYNTKSEALAEMNRIRQEKEPNAWVLYY